MLGSFSLAQSGTDVICPKARRLFFPVFTKLNGTESETVIDLPMAYNSEEAYDDYRQIKSVSFRRIVLIDLTRRRS